MTPTMTLGNMRENGVLVGWHFLIAMMWVLVAPLPVMAQARPLPSSLDEISKEAREAFRAAKTKEQVDGVKIRCKDALASLTFNEGSRLLADLQVRLKEHKAAEVKSLVAKLKALEDANDKLASAVCRPD